MHDVLRMKIDQAKCCIMKLGDVSIGLSLIVASYDAQTIAVRMILHIITSVAVLIIWHQNEGVVVKNICPKEL
jgi:hypothetical protein